MSFDKDSTFARVIEDHLELKRRNTDLEREMPISGYHVDDPSRTTRSSRPKSKHVSKTR